MNEHEGFHWGIVEQHGLWVWTICSSHESTPLVSGTTVSRAHAAACVVRTLICGVTVEAAVPSMAA